MPIYYEILFGNLHIMSIFSCEGEKVTVSFYTWSAKDWIE